MRSVVIHSLGIPSKVPSSFLRTLTWCLKLVGVPMLMAGAGGSLLKGRAKSDMRPMRWPREGMVLLRWRDSVAEDSASAAMSGLGARPVGDVGSSSRGDLRILFMMERKEKEHRK